VNRKDILHIVKPVNHHDIARFFFYAETETKKYKKIALFLVY